MANGKWDNEKNLAWIPLDEGTLFPYINWLVENNTLDALQEWIDDNPDKVVISITCDSSSTLGGGQTGWLIYYK